MEPAVEGLLSTARQLACQAGIPALSGQGRETAGRKADRTVVTSADHAIQERILGAIAREYPDHAVIAEELVADTKAHAESKSARFCWVVDPLDGTRNYVAGFPCFSTSIAVLDQGHPIVAVVVEHNLGRVFSAARGAGAWLNGEPIHVVQPEPGDDWLVAIPSTKDEFSISVASRWIATPGLVCRNTGSTALHLALVASGSLAGAFCRRCKIWDIAAGILLVAEAGGRISSPQGKPLVPLSLDGDPNCDLPFLAGAPSVFSQLQGLIEDLAHRVG